MYSRYILESLSRYTQPLLVPYQGITHKFLGTYQRITINNKIQTVFSTYKQTYSIGPYSSSNGLLNTRPCMSPRRPVLKFYSKRNYASNCHNLDCIWVINDCESIRTTFEFLAFVVTLFRHHFIITSEKFNENAHFSKQNKMTSH